MVGLRVHAGGAVVFQIHTSGLLRVKDAPATGLRPTPPLLLFSQSSSSLPLSLPSFSVCLSLSLLANWLYHVTDAFVLAQQCKLTPRGLRGLETSRPRLLATICWRGRSRIGSQSDIWRGAASVAAASS